MIKGENTVKYVVVLSLLFMGFGVDAKTMSLEEAKAFLADEQVKVLEPGIPLGRTPQNLAFLRFVAENWQQALSLLEGNAPDLRRQYLIVVAAEYLPPQDYVRFRNGVCDLMESGKLKMPGWTFYCGSFIKQGFLAYNYDQPEVAALINRIETICKAQEPGQWDKYFSEVKSGEAKKNLMKDLTSDGDPMPETYQDNSKDALRKLVKEHKLLLAGGKQNKTSSLWLYAVLSLCTLAPILYFLRRKLKTRH